MTNDDLIQLTFRGTDALRYATVMAAGKQFVLFRISGHAYWGDVMNPRAYAPVTFVLIKMGHWWMGRNTMKKEWRGRTPHSVLMAAYNKAERAGKIEEA
jgi:hypothetical protein